MLGRPERGRARDARRDPLPAQRGRPPHRRRAAAAPPRRLGELELPPRESRRAAATVTYWMNNLQRLRRRPRVLRHAQPRRGNRPGEGDRAASPTSTPSSPPRASPPSPPRRDQRRAPHPLLRRLLGLGLPRGRRRQRAARLRGDRRADRRRCTPPRPDGELPADAARRPKRRWRRERLGRLRGLGAPPPLRAGRAHLPLPALPHVPRPRRAAGGARSLPALVGPPAAPARFRRADFLGDPARPLDECARDAVEAATGARPAGPVRLLANLRYLGHCLQPGQLLLLLRRGRRAGRGGRRRGREHALGRAPRLRARARRAARYGPAATSSTRASTSRR